MCLGVCLFVCLFVCSHPFFLVPFLLLDFCSTASGKVKLHIFWLKLKALKNYLVKSSECILNIWFSKSREIALSSGSKAELMSARIPWKQMTPFIKLLYVRSTNNKHIVATFFVNRLGKQTNKGIWRPVKFKSVIFLQHECVQWGWGLGKVCVGGELSIKHFDNVWKWAEDAWKRGFVECRRQQQKIIIKLNEIFPGQLRMKNNIILNRTANNSQSSNNGRPKLSHVRQNSKRVLALCPVTLFQGLSLSPRP